MEGNFSDLFESLRDYGKTPKHSPDKFCWQIAKNISIHRSPEGEIFATIPIPPDGRMVFPLRSPFIYDCIVDFYIREADGAPHPRAVRNAIRAREAMGHPGAQETLPVFLRVAGYGKRIGPAIPNADRIIIDLNNKPGEVVAIDKDGWKVEGGWPYCLLRHRHMQPLPSPSAKAVEQPGHAQILGRFRTLLNPATTKDFHRMLIWLLAAARGSGPFPILAVDGPAASGKRTAAHLLRQTIDPSFGPFADASARDRDLLQHAQRNWVVAFDRVRRLSPRVADFINSLAAGTTHYVKHAHDPHDPTALYLQRPIIVKLQSTDGGKDPLSAHGPSLPARTLRVNLAPIPDTRRLGLDRIGREFDELWPQLFALLCTAIATALKNLPNVNPEHLPSLADAARWAVAAAPALGLTEEEILAAFDENDPDEPPLAEDVNSLMDSHDTWTGTATDLKKKLPSGRSPRTPKLLSEHLRRITRELAALGLTIAFRKTKSARLITISRVGDAKRDHAASPAPEVDRNDRVMPFDSTAYKKDYNVAPIFHKIEALRHPRSPHVRDTSSQTSIRAPIIPFTRE